MSSLKKNIIKGTVWTIVGQLSTLMLTLITNIWLARLLLPSEFGKIGIIMFFIILSSVFTEGGLAGALIRKKQATQLDYSTAFVFNLIVSIICYLTLIIFSGYIADYYNDSSIQQLLVVSGIGLIINAFQITQNAKLISELRFKQKSIYRFIAVLLASIVGLFFAYRGYGVWALVIIQLLGDTILTVLLWSFEGFYLKFKFSRSSFKELYAFGMNTTLATLLNTAFDNVYQLVLGRYFSLSQVGLFYQAKKLQDVPSGIISMLTQGVFFSSLAKLQNDKEILIRAYSKILLFVTVFTALITIFIYVYANNIILLLYGERWIGSVFYLQVLIVGSFFYTQELLNRVIFKIFNQTKQILYLEIFKKSIHLISIILGVIYLNINLLLFGFVATNVINYVMNYYYSRKVLGDVNWHEIKVVAKIALLSSILVASSINLISYAQIEGYYTFALIPLILIFYFIALKFFNVFDLFTDFKEIFNLSARRS